MVSEALQQIARTLGGEVCGDCRVRIAHPPQGMDFNDMLLSGVPSIKGGRQ
jgi:hypothetical protein